MNFDLRRAVLDLNQEGVYKARFKKDVQLRLKRALVRQFTEHLAPAREISTYAEIPRGNHWLVVGSFDRVSEGSRALRAVVGFGAGGTKMETTVKVYNLEDTSRYPFLIFKTTGGSGAEPGALSSVVGTAGTTAVVGAAAAAAGGASRGVSDDTYRTARMITAELSEYMRQRGWIMEEQALEPKTEIVPDFRKDPPTWKSVSQTFDKIGKELEFETSEEPDGRSKPGDTVGSDKVFANPPSSFR